MKKTMNKKPPKIGMPLEQRDMMYHQEVSEWLKTHPYANATEIDQMHRRLADKWRV